MKYKNLFSPINIGKLKLPNRIVLLPMSAHMSDNGEVSEREFYYTERRAAGGAGLITLGATYIHPHGNFGFQLGIESDERIEGLAKLVNAVHKHGAKISVQLHHAGRQTNAAVTGAQPVAASAIPAPGYDMPRALTKEEIKELVEAFAQGAYRAKQAGFDSAEFHCAHGYLIASFMSPHSNLRTDEYGGSFDNRMRFATEIITRAQELVGKDFPLTCRISGDELVEDGIDQELAAAIAQHFESLGVAAINVSCHLAPYVRTVPNMSFPPAVNVHLAENVKKHVNIPVLSGGRINTPELAEEILQDGKADLIGMGRALICDPDLPIKAKEGRDDDIIKCIACNKGCHDRNKEDRAVGCLLNPEVGREKDFSTIEPASEKKKVLVVGGGPAGMEAARIASIRGHEVILCEAENELGGRFRLAGVPPFKKEYHEAVKHLVKEINKSSVEIKLNTEVTPKTVKEIEPDVIVIATGAKPIYPPVEGLQESPNVSCADDILKGTRKIGDKVVVIGGGAIGAETAHYILEDKLAKEVYIVEMLSEIAPDLPQDAQLILLDEFEKLPGLKIYKETQVSKIENGVVFLEGENEFKLENVDDIIVACGVSQNKELFDQISDSEIKLIGDAREPKDALQAIYEGWKTGREI